MSRVFLRLGHGPRRRDWLADETVVCEAVSAITAAAGALRRLLRRRISAAFWGIPAAPTTRFSATAPDCPRRYSSRPRTRSCDSTSDNSSCARSSPALPLLGLFERSLSTRRSAASTRSRARSKSTKVYWRGLGGVRFFRGDARGRRPFRLTPVDFFIMSPHAPRSRRRVAEYKARMPTG